MTLTAISTWLAQLGGVGRCPFAPGTVATILIGIPAALLLGCTATIWSYVLLILLFSAACFAAELAERQADRIDPQEIVIDELVGYLVTVIGFPLCWKSLGCGLIFFRIMDIYKPWPVNLLNKETPGGVWIVLDDVGAGLYAHSLLWVTLALWP
jgi:phosphatidylglycerophosphatase A